MKSLPSNGRSGKSFLAEFDEKFTFEGFPGFVKLQSYDNLVSITNKISKLSANNLIGQITNRSAAVWTFWRPVPAASVRQF